MNILIDNIINKWKQAKQQLNQLDIDMKNVISDIIISKDYDLIYQLASYFHKSGYHGNCMQLVLDILDKLKIEAKNKTDETLR